MLVSPKAKQATKLILICIIAAVCIWSSWATVRVFSSSNEPGLATSQDVGPVHIMSTIELQRELNRRYPELKLEEDGVYGPATEAAHVRAIGDQYARELMVREIK